MFVNANNFFIVLQSEMAADATTAEVTEEQADAIRALGVGYTGKMLAITLETGVDNEIIYVHGIEGTTCKVFRGMERSTVRSWAANTEGKSYITSRTYEHATSTQGATGQLAVAGHGGGTAVEGEGVTIGLAARNIIEDALSEVVIEPSTTLEAKDIVFSPTGRYAVLSGQEGATAKIIDRVLDTFVVVTMPGLPSVMAVEFSPDETMVALSAPWGGYLTIYDVSTGDPLHSLEDDDTLGGAGTFYTPGKVLFLSRTLLLVSSATEIATDTYAPLLLWDLATNEKTVPTFDPLILGWHVPKHLYHLPGMRRVLIVGPNTDNDYSSVHLFEYDTLDGTWTELPISGIDPYNQEEPGGHAIQLESGLVLIMPSYNSNTGSIPLTGVVNISDASFTFVDMSKALTDDTGVLRYGCKNPAYVPGVGVIAFSNSNSTTVSVYDSWSGDLLAEERMSDIGFTPNNGRGHRCEYDHVTKKLMYIPQVGAGVYSVDLIREVRLSSEITERLVTLEAASDVYEQDIATLQQAQAAFQMPTINTTKGDVVVTGALPELTSAAGLPATVVPQQLSVRAAAMQSIGNVDNAYYLDGDVYYTSPPSNLFPDPDNPNKFIAFYSKDGDSSMQAPIEFNMATGKATQLRPFEEKPSLNVSSDNVYLVPGTRKYVYGSYDDIGVFDYDTYKRTHIQMTGSEEFERLCMSPEGEVQLFRTKYSSNEVLTFSVDTMEVVGRRNTSIDTSTADTMHYIKNGTRILTTDATTPFWRLYDADTFAVDSSVTLPLPAGMETGKLNVAVAADDDTIVYATTSASTFAKLDVDTWTLGPDVTPPLYSSSHEIYLRLSPDGEYLFAFKDVTEENQPLGVIYRTSDMSVVAEGDFFNHLDGTSACERFTADNSKFMMLVRPEYTMFESNLIVYDLVEDAWQTVDGVGDGTNGVLDTTKEYEDSAYIELSPNKQRIASLVLDNYEQKLTVSSALSMAPEFTLTLTGFYSPSSSTGCHICWIDNAVFIVMTYYLDPQLTSASLFLRVFDCNTDTELSTATVTFSSTPRKAVVIGTTLYVLCSGGELDVFDVTTPSPSAWVAQTPGLDITGYDKTLWVTDSGTLAFAGAAGMKEFLVSDYSVVREITTSVTAPTFYKVVETSDGAWTIILPSTDGDALVVNNELDEAVTVGFPYRTLHAVPGPDGDDFIFCRDSHVSTVIRMKAPALTVEEEVATSSLPGSDRVRGLARLTTYKYLLGLFTAVKATFGGKATIQVQNGEGEILASASLRSGVSTMPLLSTPSKSITITSALTGKYTVLRASSVVSGVVLEDV